MQMAFIGRGGRGCATRRRLAPPGDLSIRCHDIHVKLATSFDGPGVTAAASLHDAVADADLVVTFIDAPVAGGVGRAEQGRFTVMDGGGHAALAGLEPVFARFATRVGPNGAGCLAKVINNQVTVCNMLNMAEALTLAEAR